MPTEAPRRGRGAETFVITVLGEEEGSLEEGSLEEALEEETASLSDTARELALRVEDDEKGREGGRKEEEKLERRRMTTMTRREGRL